MRRTKPHHPDPIEPNRPERIETGTPATFLQCQQPLEEWRLESNGNGEQSSRRVCRLRQSAFIKNGLHGPFFFVVVVGRVVVRVIVGRVVVVRVIVGRVVVVLVIL